jgi:hypothetical protein
MNNNLLADISALPAMSVQELETLWQNTFENPPSSKNKPYMVRKLAWRLQEIRYGGLSEDTKIKLKKLRKNPNLGKRKKGMPPVGTQFIREHDGEEHRVMVLADGFEYRGCKYRSLSEIARLITGTRWSGPLFFGLKS